MEAVNLQSLWRTQKTTGRPTVLRPSLELKSKIGTPIRRSTAIHLFLFSWSSAKQEMSSYSLSPLRVAMMNMAVRPRWSPTASSSTGTATTVPLDAPDDSCEARGMLSVSTMKKLDKNLHIVQAEFHQMAFYFSLFVYQCHLIIQKFHITS